MKLLPILLLLASCSSGLIIRPGSCTASVKVKDGRERAQKSVTFLEREYGVGSQVVTIDELLEEAKGPSCSKLKDLRIAIESDGIDQLVSVIPFVSQWTVTLEWDEVATSSK